MSKKSKTDANQIVVNRKARHDYFVENATEAGLVLEGWEVKSLREGKVQLNEAYVLLKDGEAFLFGCLITPLPTASTHINPDSLRTRKLLLHQRELNKLFGAVKQKGFTCVPLDLHWKRGHIKCTIALARGKKLYDKRATEKERDWQRQKQRIARDH
ncbi:MAG: SsrA-binding protein SmpB [Gammaproteobacteria bacterium]